jgi:protein-arginine kinase activator protein McsA
MDAKLKWDFFISASCPLCSGVLDTPIDQDRFRCRNCYSKFVLADLMPQIERDHAVEERSPAKMGE